MDQAKVDVPGLVVFLSEVFLQQRQDIRIAGTGLQEEHYNLRISDATASVLNASLEKREEMRKGRESLLPGTQFVREWHGEKHVLIYRGPKQYEYLGQTYRSPSVVAKRITGTNWNGREFFHLPSLKSMKQED